MDYNNLLQVLMTAASPARGQEQKLAENKLKEWEAEKGFHYMLQSVYINRELPLQIRWLAVICLKNGIEKYWRPTRINSITKEEKIEIKKRLFDLLDESNNQLSIQNAHLISRICRLDFPVEWPTLFEDIVNIMELCSNDLDNGLSIIKLNNLMIMLNQILKILSTVRIGKARIMMQTKAPIVLPHLIKFYNIFFNRWIADLGPASTNPNIDLAIMQVGYIFLKNIRRLIVDGYNHQNRDKTIQEFMDLSLQHFQKLLMLHESNKLDLLEKYIKCYVKLYFNLVSDNTCSFILIQSSKNIMLTLLSVLQQKAQIIYEDADSDFWEKIAIKSFIIMKTITNYTFKESTTNIVKQRGDKLEIQQSIDLLKSNFFTLELVENLINLITNYYLKLTPNDLENWENDPEEWFNEELSSNYEFQIRKCAENYFQDLSIYFSEFLSSFITNKIENLNSDSLDLLTKDSILCIFQLSSNSIKSKCNFSELLFNYFIPQAISNDSPLIKRRTCLIIDEWIDESINSELRIKIYEFLANLLINSGNDIILKLTSIQSLKYLIDDWEFRKKDFQNFSTNIINESINLLNNLLKSIETKNFILKFLSILIERNTPLINDLILIEIVKIIPVLWENSNNPNEMIIKNSLLRILKDLITSLNKNSYKIYDIVIPLIPYCCDSKSEYYSLLCEDGLELWSSVMKTIDLTSNIPEKLLDSQMLEILINSLINFTEILPLILNIIRSYYLVSVNVFDNQIGLKIFEILSSYLKTMRDDSVFLTSSILEVSIMQNSNSKGIFYNNLISSRLFSELIDYLIRDTDSPYCEIKISLPILRMMIDNCNIFLENIEDSVTFYKLLLNLTKFAKNSFDPKIRKLYLLGLLSLYKKEYLQNSIVLGGTNDEEIEYELNQINKSIGISSILQLFVKRIVNLCILFAEEIKEEPNGDLKAYHKQTSYDDEELKPYEPEDEDKEDNEYALEMMIPINFERERYTILVKTCDVVRNVKFNDVLRNIIGDVYDVIGGNLDGVILEELQFLK